MLCLGDMCVFRHSVVFHQIPVPRNLRVGLRVCDKLAPRNGWLIWLSLLYTSAICLQGLNVTSVLMISEFL